MKIMIVDDDPLQRQLLMGFLENRGYNTLTAADSEQALALFQREHIHLVLLDYRMPGLSGDAALREMKAINPMVRCIIITAYGDVNTAVAALKLGADEFLEKPVDLPALLEKIEQMENQIAVEKDVQVVEETMAQEALPLRLVAESGAMKQVISLVRRVAASPWPVLIQGETGTGKEIIARLVHLLSPRKDSAFIEVNCAAIPENLFESELFGHEKGAFTSAVNSRRGRFELARGGSLFLDEIGDMPLQLQPKVLRALQEKRITRVGGEKDIQVDIRLISATNRNLKQMAEAGVFREDLYYRLKVLEIDLPPLRQRREDIPALLDFFLERYATRPMQFAAEALDCLIKYPFPGNVREIEHIVQRTITLSRASVIRFADLPEEVRHHQAIIHGTFAERLAAVEQEMLLSALQENDWVQTKAAEMLGISERVLRYKIKKYRIKG